MLDMGQKIRIVDLAHKMIRLRGLRPGQDIPLIYTGVRPGEKLHEELLAPDEKRHPTTHPGIFRVQSSQQLDSEAVTALISYLVELVRARRNDEIRAVLSKLMRTETNGKRPMAGLSGSSPAIDTEKTLSTYPLHMSG